MKKQPLTDTPIPRHQVILFLGNTALIILAVYCTFGALVSSFSLPVNMTALFLVWLSAAVVASIVAMRYRGKGLLILLIPILFLFLLGAESIIAGGRWAIYEITTQYSNWLPVTALYPESGALAGTIDRDLLAFFATTGSVIILLLAFSICLRRSVFITIAVTAPIIFLTFIITNLQADLLYLLGLIAVYLTLLVSSAVSPDDYNKRGLRFLPSFAIAIVIMTITYLFASVGSYSREEQIAGLGNRFRVIASQIGRFGQFWQPQSRTTVEIAWLGSLGIGVWHFNTDNVNVADAGIRTIYNQNLLEIAVSEPGTFYLRGYSMQYFNGRAWENNDVVPDEQGEMLAKEMPAVIAELYSMTNQTGLQVKAFMRIIRTGDLTHNISYRPYYSRAIHPDLLASTNEFYHIEGSVHALAEATNSTELLSEYLERMHIRDVYTEIDIDTAQGLRQLATEAGIDINADRAAIADAVARYIRTSGVYTFSPGQIPAGEDFALYFLQTSQEGYCIHFATAAVLMLRSLDIPARFTSGYVVTVLPGDVNETVVLTDMNAHAWVEVFYDYAGWLYLEVTPSSGDTYIPEPGFHFSQENITPPQPVQTPDEQDSMYDDRPYDGYTNGEDFAGAEVSYAGQDDIEFPRGVILTVMAVAAVAAAAAALLIRASLANRVRTRNFMQADTNTAVIYAWRYINRVGSGHGTSPEYIEELALKARFSQHKLTEEERIQIIKYAKMLSYEVYSTKSGIFHFWMKYIRGL